ncbi:hypothetical protein GC173_01000 [bacterium]|nr:hypothetical protein [bacterium]
MHFRPTAYPAFLLVALLVAICATGCGGRGRFQSAWPEADLKAGKWAVADKASLLTSLAATSPHRPELLVDAGVKARTPAGGGFVSIRALYQEPDRIRLRGSRLDITLFDLLLRDGKAHLYIRDEGARYDGTMADLSRASRVIGGLSPRELVASLQVLSELRRVLESSEPVVVSDEGTNLLVVARVGIERAQGFWLVRKSDGLVREFLLRDRFGNEQIRVSYLSYKLEGDGRQPMPSNLTLQLLPEDSTFKINVNEYRLEPALRPQQFEPPEARRVRPLSQLGAPGGTT